MRTHRIKLWDLPTRLFHGLLIMLMIAAIITGQIGGGAIEWHGRIGLCLLGLIAFRLAWGLIGSSHSRFANFFPTPTSVRAYLNGQWQGVGHNPLGAFSVFGLLALITLQITTGLLSNDDIAFDGPLSGLISKALSDDLGELHEFIFGLLLTLIALHLAAILFYTYVKKDPLIKPMITGWKDIKPGEGESTTGGGALAFVLAVLIALAVVYAGSGQWIPAPPPVTTPAATW